MAGQGDQPHRDRDLIAALAALVPAGALLRPLLVCFDGLRSYVTCFQRALARGGPTGGRPRLVPWDGLCLGQVKKHKQKGRVVGVTRQLVPGSKEPMEALLFGANVINTAYIERLNATFRTGCRPSSGASVHPRPGPRHRGAHLLEMRAALSSG